MNVRMRSEPKGFVILLLSLCYRYLELILCLWLNVSMLQENFNKEPGRSKVFHSNNWLGIILLHFSDINILEDIKHVHLTNWSLFNYLCLLKFIFQFSIYSWNSALWKFIESSWRQCIKYVCFVSLNHIKNSYYKY